VHYLPSAVGERPLPDSSQSTRLLKDYKKLGGMTLPNNTANALGKDFKKSGLNSALPL
jgi:hypothetical protein